jgi:hypothetical protein
MSYIKESNDSTFDKIKRVSILYINETSYYSINIKDIIINVLPLLDVNLDEDFKRKLLESLEKFYLDFYATENFFNFLIKVLIIKINHFKRKEGNFHNIITSLLFTGFPSIFKKEFYQIIESKDPNIIFYTLLGRNANILDIIEFSNNNFNSILTNRRKIIEDKLKTFFKKYSSRIYGRLPKSEYTNYIDKKSS